MHTFEYASTNITLKFQFTLLVIFEKNNSSKSIFWLKEKKLS